MDFACVVVGHFVIPFCGHGSGGIRANLCVPVGVIWMIVIAIIGVS